MAEDSLGEDATQKVSSDHPPVSVSTRQAAPPPGTLIGKYVVEHTIGSGGMGIVVSARHEHLGELVAIKLLHPKAAKDQVQVERFVREARATVRIKSEHVVRVLDAGTDAITGAPFIVMEHLEGRDLGKILEAHGAMPVTMAVDIMMQICEAVAAAHALGIIHRDLKPSNFFVSKGRDGGPLVKVLDFGISKASEQNGVADPRLTETQAVFGSPTYMSPEQIRSSKNVDPRSDVWSLGVALFEMLTGKLPFVADNVSGLLASVVADAPFRVSIFSPDVPPDLERIVHGCLEKDASRRVGSAVELALHLAPFASPEGKQLATRIERMDRSNSTSTSSRPSFTSGPPRPSSTHPSLPPLSAPLPPRSSPSGVGAVAFGSTGDMSATGSPRRPSRRNALVAVMAMLALILALAGVLVVLLRTPSRGPASARAAQPPPPALETPPPAVAEPTTAPLRTPDPATADAPSSSSSSAAANARRGPRPPTPTPPNGRPAGASRASASASAAPASASAAPPATPPPAPPSTPRPKPDDDRL